MISALQTALSGLLSASTRAQIASSNIVNANVESSRTFSADSSSSIAGNRAYQPLRATDVSAPGGGVRTVASPIRPSQTPVFSPGSPLANDEGLVNLPNVSLAEEFVQLRIAVNTYKANAAVIRTADEILGSLLDDTK